MTEAIDEGGQIVGCGRFVWQERPVKLWPS